MKYTKMIKVGDTVKIYDKQTGHKVNGVITEMSGVWNKVRTSNGTTWVTQKSLEHIEEVVLPSKDYHDEY